MEPRPLGRGMSMSPSINGSGSRGLQWSHDLSVVECRSPPSRGPAPRARFNGATTSRSWNARTNWALLRLRSRGFNGATTSRSWNATSSGTGARRSPRFNGATTSRSWNGRRLAPPRPSGAGFNGATTSRSWNVAYVNAVRCRPLGLQWSHDLSVVECTAVLNGASTPGRLQWSHDLSVVECSPDLVGAED